jgi:hypothetical protein
MEYFIQANSFAAPFFSDTSTHFQKGSNPKKALENFAKKYKHPCGLFAANIYLSAEAFHKGKPPLKRWLSNHARFLEGKTGSIKCDAPGEIWLNGEYNKIERPKEGCVFEIS